MKCSLVIAMSILLIVTSDTCYYHNYTVVIGVASGFALTLADFRHHNVPALFVMGDSLADVGNNNYITQSIFKSNYLPYGIDFPGRHLATGRFSNGRLVIDIIANTLGVSIPSPYLSPNTKGLTILQGVNYASAGCGILNETTNNSSGCLSFSTQMSYHKNIVHKITQQVGLDDGQSFLNQSLYFVFIGSNDFLGNYIRNSSHDSKLTPQQFIDLLISSYATQLKTLYNLYARKIVLVGLGPLGCIPNMRVKTSNGSCNENLNTWAQQFNSALQELVGRFTSNYTDAIITLANPYLVLENLIQNPLENGFSVTNEACCGGGRLHAQIPCFPLFTYCSNRSNHVFWDPWHPTEASNIFLVNSFLSANKTLVGPWTITELISK